LTNPLQGITRVSICQPSEAFDELVTKLHLQVQAMWKLSIRPEASIDSAYKLGIDDAPCWPCHLWQMRGPEGRPAVTLSPKLPG
jgi:hypothetical protein